MNLADRRRLHAARELVEIALVDVCLDALDIALRLEHPTLDEARARGDPGTLRRARAVVRIAAALRDALRAYQKAVDDVLTHEPRDDLPF